MKINVLGYSNFLGELNEESILNAAGQFGRVCYLPGTKFSFNKELNEKDINRGKMIIESGHHSITEHIWVTLQFEDCPKIITTYLYAMGFYAASEKSARYTRMSVGDGWIQDKFDKWEAKFMELIEAEYPDMDKKMMKKLAIENAAYFISVFNPTTAIISMPINMLNYVYEWSEDYIIQIISNENTRSDRFFSKLSDALQDFNTEFKKVVPMVEGLFDKRSRDMRYIKKMSNEEFDEKFTEKCQYGTSYTTIYAMSFRVVAQAIRHRLMRYELYIDTESPVYYIPTMIKYNSDLIDEWLTDMAEVEEYVPQATLFNVIETGNIDGFITKCKERLCGRVQLEMAEHTATALMIYDMELSGIEAFEDERTELNKFIKDMKVIPRCMHPEFKCLEPCYFGPKMGLERLI